MAMVLGRKVVSILENRKTGDLDLNFFFPDRVMVSVAFEERVMRVQGFFLGWLKGSE